MLPEKSFSNKDLKNQWHQDSRLKKKYVNYTNNLNKLFNA